jgi:hypothetical protein
VANSTKLSCPAASPSLVCATYFLYATPRWIGALYSPLVPPKDKRDKQRTQPDFNSSKILDPIEYPCLYSFNHPTFQVTAKMPQEVADIKKVWTLESLRREGYEFMNKTLTQFHSSSRSAVGRTLPVRF